MSSVTVAPVPKVSAFASALVTGMPVPTACSWRRFETRITSPSITPSADDRCTSAEADTTGALEEAAAPCVITVPADVAAEAAVAEGTSIAMAATLATAERKA
ncbi:hypothetical protein H7U32_04640 [Bifidobacterium pullorum subsp. saeculare]|uniref:Uncharacterized protein n=1 Tax=Bifidobacterium pullorum subsp. saeculare TaxID=78257 RepID=A0A938WXE6_9BIFI|nr:hypothetical protein [Bifidobacterium pullorum]MBM6699611.1 hypothetical protein [Bifidobacterium pullorum subsp. saeculare]